MSKINNVIGLEVRRRLMDIEDLKNLSAEAQERALSAEEMARLAELLSKSTKEELDQIVIEGDSSVEAAQARVDAEGEPHKTLKARLDYEYDKTVMQLDAEIQKTGDISLLGTAPRSLAESISERGINIKDFGAKGNANHYNESDGNWYADKDFITLAHDDSEAFKSALKYLQDLKVAISKELFIPKGNYLIDDELMIDDWGLTVHGQGRESELIAGKNIDRAMFISMSDERKNKSGTGLRDVVFEFLHLNGNGRDVNGFQFAGFTRGCAIKNCRVARFGGTQILLNGSWCFSLESNIIEGVRDSSGGNDYRGQGIGLATDPSDGEFLGTTEVNIPTVINNSMQFLGRGMRWMRGSGGFFAGNTFENNVRHLYIYNSRAFAFNGNYFESAYRQNDSVEFGGVGAEAEVRSMTFEGNYFSKAPSINLIKINGLKNSTLKNNYFSNNTGYHINTPSNLPTGKIVGNEIHVASTKIYEGTSIDRGKNTLVFTDTYKTSIPELLSVLSVSHDDHSEKSTQYIRQLNASINSIASGRYSLVNGSTNSEATGDNSQVNGSGSSSATHERSNVLSSIRVATARAYSLTGGYGSAESGTSSKNRKWEIAGTSGNLTVAGQITGDADFSDFGEYFPNGFGQEIPLGTIVTLDGDKVVPAKNNDDPIGVVSGTAGIILGDSPFSWQGRYLTGEFGEPIYEYVKDDAYELKEGESEEDRPLLKVRKENPKYNPKQRQVPRSDRPEEWTLVGLVGQVYVRIDDTVSVGNYLKSADDGTGTKSSESTNIRVMKITKKYDGDYGVAYCLIK